MWTIVVAILALGLTALLPLAFTIRKRELGPNPARDERLRSILEIVIVVLVVLLAAIGCFRGLADPWRSPALAGMVWITTIASIVHSVRERRGAGSALLELGRPPEARMSLAVTVMAAVALALMAVADFSDQRGVGLQTLSRMAVGLAIVTGSAYSYAVGWRHEIREHGFVVLRLLSWGQIRDY